ncbi:putative type I restriction enzymeP M protein [Methanobrevibacter cuticularis]|uniref:site-specific DNA-methyltransferase (adenine-specific) n=1 Tax=Methanobrevibacter cuticularis TaxID=47311 RepID=A0A166EGA9_9EURY|nr:N-6 DNA methylase [Methanobrevibacter cuticularis]KZX16621.1 putative type I restriction enzymeP M protein [Methanobrevibacter cuticularis]
MKDYEKEFLENFENLTGKHEITVIFNHFLDFIIDNFTLNNKREWENYNEIYTNDEKKIFNNLFENFIIIMESKINENRYYDYLGVFYESIIQSKYKAGDKGQFFTPHNIVDFIIGLNHNLKKGNVVNDPTCGSGRLLIGHQSKNQDCYLLGSDLDIMACKMCVINLLIHGGVGSVIWENSLSGEFYGAWKVNEYLNTGGFLLSVEKVNNRNNALFFMKTKDVGIVGSKKQKQTTLL